MQFMRTYHHAWVMFLALLMMLSAWTSLAAKAECACVPESILETAHTCCHPPTPTAQETTSCTKDPALTSDCCCDTTPCWNALSTLSDGELEVSPIGLSGALLTALSKHLLAPSFSSFIETHLYTAAWYTPPLLYQDRSVLFQSFLC